MMKLMVVLASILSLFGCHPKEGDPIVSFKLTSSGMRHAYRYEVRETDEGRVYFHSQGRGPNETTYYMDNHAVLDTLDRIVRKYHMNRYRSHYRPMAKILDGTNWSIFVEYASGKTISSSGYHVGPRNWGRAREKLMQCLDYWNNQPDDMDNKDTITYFSLSKGGGMAMFSGFSYAIQTTKDGQVHFLFNEAHPDEKEFTIDDHSVFDSLQRIVLKHKMYDYENDYSPEIPVTDGMSWSLYVKYASGKWISSGGYMAGPKGYGDAFNDIHQCLKPWKDLPVPTNEVVSFLYEYGADRYTLRRVDDHTEFTHDNVETGEHQVLERSLDMLEDLRITFNIGRLKMNQTRHQPDAESTLWMYDITYANGDHYRYESYDGTYQCGYTRMLQNFISEWMSNENKTLDYNRYY